MAGKHTVFPDGPLIELRQVLEFQIREVANTVVEDFVGYFDRSMRETVLAGLNEVEADEGTIWLIDSSREALIPVFNSGPHASEFVGRFRQTLRSGMISMVVATEQSICENEVHRDQRQDRSLDSQLGVRTCAMIAAPFYFAGELRGVLSGVQLRQPDDTLPDPKGFCWSDLQVLQRTATVFARLLEHRIIKRLIATNSWS